MLRLTTQQSEETKLIILKGRITVVGKPQPGRTYTELAPTIPFLTLAIASCNITYADRNDIQTASSISLQFSAGAFTGRAWTKFLAEEVKRASATQN